MACELRQNLCDTGALLAQLELRDVMACLSSQRQVLRDLPEHRSKLVPVAAASRHQHHLHHRKHTHGSATVGAEPVGASTSAPPESNTSALTSAPRSRPLCQQRPRYATSAQLYVIIHKYILTHVHTYRHGTDHTNASHSTASQSLLRTQPPSLAQADAVLPLHQ